MRDNVVSSYLGVGTLRRGLRHVVRRVCARYETRLAGKALRGWKINADLAECRYQEINQEAKDVDEFRKEPANRACEIFLYGVNGVKETAFRCCAHHCGEIQLQLIRYLSRYVVEPLVLPIIIIIDYWQNYCAPLQSLSLSLSLEGSLILISLI